MLNILLVLFLSFSLFADETLDTIEVTHQGTSSTLVDFVPSVTTIKEKELTKKREATLGDTLRSVPGVQSSGFGPNATRPIIRGLEGDRIRVLQNGLGVLDASAQSADHAVPVDTMVIDSIEVVRGPMSLLYGSSAVGGVVNINTNRIHSVYEEGSIKQVQVEGDSSQMAIGAGAKLDYGVDQWMFHFDGGYRNAGDLRIPANGAESANNLGERMNVVKLPNSEALQKSASVGASKIFNSGYLGMSYYFLDYQYGTVADPNVDIGMKQNRVELHGEYRVRGKTLKSVRLKTAQSDYSHKEYEGSEVGTTFSNEGNESRLEFISEGSNVKGVSGFQANMFNFSATGNEAYLPPSRNKNISVFTLQDFSSENNIYSLGARAESGHVHDQSSGGKSRNFTGYNGSLGLRHQFSETHMGLVSLSYTERLPNFQELFADGFHVASGTFEQGNEDLRKEKAFALDASLRYTSDVVQTNLSIYAQEFKDYVSLFLTDTASSEPGVNISEFRQVDAIFYGAEFDGKKSLGESPYNVILKADFVRAKDKDSGKNLPRISPPRVTLGLERVKDRWNMDVEAQYNFEQTKTADNESSTDSFTLFNAGVMYDLIKNRGKWSFFGRLRNILNQEARLHTSTLKEIAPLAGRNIVGGVQYTF